MISNDPHALPALSSKQTAITALNEIKEEKDFEGSGLKCRWESVNRAILKNWRFKNVVTLGGASGSGKSYIANMLCTDFTDFEPISIPEKKLSLGMIDHLTTVGEFARIGEAVVRMPINGDYKKKVLVLKFGFDMLPQVDMMRTVSGMMGVSYAHLLSSSATKIVPNKYTYNKVTDEEFYVVQRILKGYSETRPNIIYFRQTANQHQIEVTIDKYKNMYPNYDFVIMIDHTLLLDKVGNEGDQELMDNQAKKYKDWRDIYGALVMPLTQLNSDIEDDRRRLNPKLQYPIKSDLYRGGQLFQSSDYVFVAFMPSSIHIAEYGPKKIPTDRLLHLALIKSRHGEQGHVWLYNALDKGSILNAQLPNNNKPGASQPIKPQKTLCHSW